MARFTTRVELHKADSGDYQTLHEAMYARRFTSTIAGTDGKKKQLPTAEYNFDGDLKREDVLNLAIAAADSTGCKSSILVTESAGRTWNNLPAA